MPATSKSQFRLMQAAAHGQPTKGKVDPAVAKEFIAGQSPKGLPEKVRKPKRTLADRVLAKKYGKA